MTRAELLAYIDSNVYPNANNEITALMVRDVLHRMVGFMGDAATYGVGDVAPSNPGLVTGGAVQGAINTALSSAIKFQGVTTTPLTDGSTDPDIVIAGDPYTARRGDEVIYGGREFLWTGSLWQQLGDEQSWALKTITISAGAGLVGGGDLTQNRTISLSQDSLNKLALAASAYQVPQGGIPKADLASDVQTTLGSVATIAGYFSGDKLKYANLPDLYLARTQVSGTAANKTLYGVDGISHAAAADNTDESRVVWDADNDAWHFYGNIYTDGWFSGGGISQGGGGGGGGIDPAAMWSLLGAPTSEQINSTHISFPVTSVVGLQGAVSAAQIAAALGLGSLAYQSALTSAQVTNALGYTPANVTALEGYLPLAGGTLTGPIIFDQSSTSRRNGIIGTYDPNRAAAIWTIGSSYQIAADGLTLGDLYGACYVYYGDGYTYGAGKSGGHSFVWANEGVPVSAIGNNIWTSGGFIKDNSSNDYFLLGGGGHVLRSTYALASSLGNYLPLAGGTMTGRVFTDYYGQDWPLQINTNYNNVTSTFAAGLSGYGVYIGSNANSGTAYLLKVVNGESAHGSGGNPILTITAGGRVGIGTDNPQYNFHVYGTTGWSCWFNTNNAVVVQAHGDGYGMYIGSTRNDSTHYLLSINYGESTPGAGGQVALFVTANGRVGIGTNSPSEKLDVAGVIHATTGIWTDGYFSGGGLSQSSDARLKTAIKDFAYSSSLLMSLRPREWDWNGKAAIRGHAAGFVAQDVEPLMPYSVDKSRNYLALFYEHFHAVEISALQDHERRIVALEKRFNVN